MGMLETISGSFSKRDSSSSLHEILKRMSSDFSSNKPPNWDTFFLSLLLSVDILNDVNEFENKKLKFVRKI